MRIKAFALVGLLAVVGNAQAQAGKADPLVGTRLEAEKLKYEVDADGDYKLVFNVSDGRTQAVWVRSATETLGGMKIREVMSVGGRMPDAGDNGAIGLATMAALSVQAMRESSNKKLGGWVLKGDPAKSEEAFYYVAQLPADANATDLRAVIESVATSADEFEREIEGLDANAKKDAF